MNKAKKEHKARKNTYILLIVLLLILLTISIVLNLFIDSNGFLINIASEIIGILLTIIFVDRFIKINEKEKWKGIDYKVKKYSQILINGTITSIRGAFGYSLEDVCDSQIYDALFANPKDLNLIEHELIRISKEILEPTVSVKINKMNQESWKIINSELKHVYESAERILSLFGSMLSPKQFEVLLDIQESINNIFIQCTTWPDIIAVKKEDLPIGGRVSSEEFQKTLNYLLSEYIKSLLHKVRELYGII